LIISSMVTTRAGACTLAYSYRDTVNICIDHASLIMSERTGRLVAFDIQCLDALLGVRVRVPSECLVLTVPSSPADFATVGVDYLCPNRPISPEAPFVCPLSAASSSSRVRPGCSAFGSKSVAMSVKV